MSSKKNERQRQYWRLTTDRGLPATRATDSLSETAVPTRLIRRRSPDGHTATVIGVRDPSIVEAWGSSVHDRAAVYPCDGLIDGPDRVVFRAVDIAAPAALAFRWLCQLRAAPYSYDWVDNFGRRSPRRLIPGLDRLEVGQRFMSIFRLVSFEEGRSITLDSTTVLFGRVATTYLVVPVATDRSRLVVKLAFTAPRGLLGSVMRRLLPSGDLVMMRKQLLTLQALAERDAGELSG